MRFNEVKKRFEEVNIGEDIVCTQQELELFLSCGLLFPDGSRYATRDGAKVHVTDVGDNKYKMTLNFKALLDAGASLCKDTKNKKVYFMSKSTFDSYLAEGLIMSVDDEMVFRLYDKEYWKICKI